MSILIGTLLDRVQKEFLLPEVVWENSELSSKDLNFLKEECYKDSEFDPNNKRKTMYDGMVSGKFICNCIKV